jgi:hypothetical protein
MIRIKELDALTSKFAQCALDPLRVTFYLEHNARVVNYDPIHLDGLLARAVVERATRGRLLADCEDGYWIPLPLQMLWQSDDGFPLWASTMLYPAAKTIKDVYVRHKRNSGGELHNRKKMITRKGSWMERRIPTPTLVCDRYEAYCVGNLDAVQNLLGGFARIGKLRLARVNGVKVEPVDEFSLWRGDKLARPVPAESKLIDLVEKPSLVGWTPPHWKPSLFSPGWQAGTRRAENLREFLDLTYLQEIDYFDAV